MLPRSTCHQGWCSKFVLLTELSPQLPLVFPSTPRLEFAVGYVLDCEVALPSARFPLDPLCAATGESPTRWPYILIAASLDAMSSEQIKTKEKVRNSERMADTS
jgi:hypothetical protein